MNMISKEDLMNIFEKILFLTCCAFRDLKKKDCSFD